MSTYRRSYTAMDRVSMFTPMNLRGLRGRLGQDAPADNVEMYDYGYTYSDAPVVTLPPATGPSDTGWNWQKALDNAPSVLRDLMLANSTADYQAKLMQLNLERAKKGQPPLDAAQYAPRVQVGVAPQTMKVAGLGIGAIAAIATGAYLLANMGGSRSRRR